MKKTPSAIAGFEGGKELPGQGISMAPRTWESKKMDSLLEPPKGRQPY